MSTCCQVSKDVATTIILGAVFILAIKIRYDCRLFESGSIYIYIISSMIYILYSDSVNNGTIIFDFSTNTTSVYEARTTYIRIFTNVIYLDATSLSRVYKSRPFYRPTQLSSFSAILQGRSRLSRFERFTYVSRRIRPHLGSFLSRTFTFFFLPARMLVSRADRSGRTRLYSNGGLRTPALEDFIEGFPKEFLDRQTPPATTT